MALRALQNELTYGAFSQREKSVSSHVPYTRHIDDNIIKTRNNYVLNVIKLEGYPFETQDISEINAKLLSRNDLVRTLNNSRWALASHIIRREIIPEIRSTFDNPLCAMIDQRYTAALSKRRMFVNDLYLTLIRRPLQGNAGRAEVTFGKMFSRKSLRGDDVALLEATSELRDATVALKEVLKPYGARLLGVREEEGVFHSEPLEFLVQLINGARPRPMPLPRLPLNEAMALKRLFFGKNTLEIRGASPDESRFGAVLSVREYPSMSGPGSLDTLLRVPHEIIVSQTFGLIDRPEALKQIDRVERQVSMSDEGGTVVADHLHVARNELVSSESAYGEHHMTVLCLGKTLQEVAAAVTATGAALTDRSVIWVREDLNSEMAFWAQLPGNFAYIARKSIISSKNFAGFMSLHNYPSGTPTCNHWGPAISLFETESQTAYYYNMHIKDVGHFTVVGPTGSGKTVFLAFISAQSQRIYPRPKLIFMDKDRGCEIFIRAMGGQYEDLQPGEPTGFNPLMMEDTGENRALLEQLFSFMLRPPKSGDSLTATETQVINSAISTVLRSGPEGRKLTAFQELLRGRIRAGEDDLASRLQPWLVQSQRGWLFNNDTDSFEIGQVFGFDMTRVLDDPTTRTAALMYIFHRIEKMMTGDPVMIFLDEGWKLLDDPIFSDFIKDKLKTLRKKNGVVGFGTQSAADIVNSDTSSTLLEQSKTNIFFPNPRADDNSYRIAFQLSKREINWIRRTAPESRTFLIKHGTDSVIAKLNLAGMPEIIKVLSGRAETLAEMMALRTLHGDAPSAWLPEFMGEPLEAPHAPTHSATGGPL
ncbi:VirB4 family type IV secretion/conjugal transfer ATPase [Methylorubrum rhodesianum]|jgi:type IV secretion system protein VirB4|uniref:VirB4 family type IV secretion/conjugal transfer ATPase n=1 Tax=Methylorubrum rhodesianum TaxID=29427 RepID=UPI003D07D7AD